MNMNISKYDIVYVPFDSLRQLNGRKSGAPCPLSVQDGLVTADDSQEIRDVFPSVGTALRLASQNNVLSTRQESSKVRLLQHIAWIFNECP